jgi:hypothetical protein
MKTNITKRYGSISNHLNVYLPLKRFLPGRIKVKLVNIIWHRSMMCPYLNR